MEQQYLTKVGYGIRWLFLQDHKANRYRSRFWYVLPLLLNLPGGLVAFFAIRHDDLDKAKNCLLLGTLLFIIPPLVFGIISLVMGNAIID